MRNQDKPKMAMKKTVTKMVAKPSGKMPAKVSVKTTKSVVAAKSKAIPKSPELEAKRKKALTQKERIMGGIKKGIKAVDKTLYELGSGAKARTPRAY
jgi:hypothetical protein